MALKSSKQEAPLRTLPCAHDLCPNPAMVRLKLEHGWVCLCRHHYDFHAQRQANEFCAKNGLLTLEQKRGYCLEKARAFGYAGRAAMQKIMKKAA
jgi:hypothetical protein